MGKTIGEAIVARIVYEMDPAAVVIDKLHSQGYVHNFELIDSLLYCRETGIFYALSDVAVDEIYKFEDNSKALGVFCVYALKDKWNDVKGLFACESCLEKKLDF